MYRIALAEALTRAGLRDLLRGPCVAAMDLLEDYTEFDSYVVFYMRLAPSLGELGDADLIRKALAALGRVEPRFLPWKAATPLAAALGDADAPRDGRQALLRIRSTLEAFGIERRLDDYLAVGRALVTLGAAEAGRSVLYTVRDLAGTLKDPRDQAGILPQVAEALHPLERLTARELLERSLQMIGRLESPLDREQALPKVARALRALEPGADGWAAGALLAGFEAAWGRGRHDVLVSLGVFGPVLERLGVIRPVWDRVAAAERFLAALH
jgi:hypothetical protein